MPEYASPEVLTLFGSCGEGLAGHGPLEGLGESVVEVVDEGFHPGFQIFLGGEARAAQDLSRQDRQPISIWLSQDACFGVK